ncbi:MULTISPECIES: serine/threonine protein kinase [Bacillus cereus group]|uniref:Protein kinase domain protein n=1 Tax=Bacillus cereus (strain AH820) TaxID=405535 RepID=B7JMN4_BACC0|nr:MULTISPECIES: serine/threonine-protein kinase [Bacillus cereus group]HDR7534062.1 serine/threonine protein kinase [Bacillus anthracis]ACK87729.1 protein kinase domain protein [Bacillus cereus AH820]KAA0750610.1 serine/threonine protein kinase [Bacillus sp. AY1-10]MCQ0956224.1 serine/threonine protein kinase [Bacillus cereus]MDA1815680.1 serine/threonine-protein kinase [Bacillus cereus]
MKWRRILALFDRPLRKNTIVAERYKIESVIGMGSYGVTYVVNDLQINRYKVLKQLRQSKQRYVSGRKSFEQEKMILQTLNHHAIPSLYDHFVWEKKSFFVMEYMPGKNFEDYIFLDGHVYTEREVLKILYQILEIVSVFHSKDIIHRDLRIPNILMKENQISIIDFGLAKWKGEGDERATTYEGEQALMREVHFRSDFYALGHFSLFLLYAGYESNEKYEKSWYDELTLENYNREMLMRMLQMKTPYYENVRDLKKDVAFALERMEVPCFKSF